MTNTRSWILAGLLGSAAAAVAFATPHAREPAPTHEVPPAKNGGTVVELCDGETTVEVTGDMTPEKARAASTELMRQWRAKNPDALWDDKVVVAQAAPGKQAQHGAPVGAQPKTQSDIYGGYTQRDQKIWAVETAKFIEEGNKIFHDAKALGGTVAISCDMCHPDAANTHPETYPKFQVQLGKVALLRDMINWCIENPVKGKPMLDEDRRMRALEAYILSQRRGVPLDYGKH